MISFSLICKRNLPFVDETESQDELATRVLKLTHIRLDRESITNIDNLDCLGPITNLYLQQNLITKLENLDTLVNLRFLTVSHNQIEKTENLLSLTSLQVLDLSHNKIDQLEEDQIPCSVTILSLAGNPCASIDDYHERLMSKLVNLRRLDGKVVRGEEEGETDEQKLSTSDPAPLGMPAITLKIHERTQLRLQEANQIYAEHKSQLEQLHRQYRQPREDDDV